MKDSHHGNPPEHAGSPEPAQREGFADEGCSDPGRSSAHSAALGERSADNLRVEPATPARDKGLPRIKRQTFGLKSAYQRLTEASDEIARLGDPDEKPTDLESYDESIKDANRLAAQAVALLTACRDLAFERERDRPDFIMDLQEDEDFRRNPEAFYGVSGQF